MSGTAPWAKSRKPVSRLSANHAQPPDRENPQPARYGPGGAITGTLISAGSNVESITLTDGQGSIPLALGELFPDLLPTQRFVVWPQSGSWLEPIPTGLTSERIYLG